MGSSVPPVEETLLQGGTKPVTYEEHPVLAWRDSMGDHAVEVQGRHPLGSAKDNVIVVTDPHVSRLHAVVELEKGAVWVRDIGSRNGTYVNGVLVRYACVPDGGELRVGSTVLAARYGAARSPVDLWDEDSFGPLRGRSPAMRRLFTLLARVAPSTSSVLVQGETGTGKELVARAIHEASPRATRPFVVVDCAALPETLLDAELFGHARGAFTGAAGARAGAIEAADGGTVFLDEIGELPLAMQPKLLRALESRSVRRLGETEHRKVDVRFVSATHRDLLSMINAGHFREDLYFRLAVLPVFVPPLRDRREDIPLLVEHFLAAAGATPSPDLIRDLVARPWRGNVRELRNFAERAAAVGAREALLMEAGASSAPSATPEPSHAIALDQPFKSFREAWMDRGERDYLAELLARHERNVVAAAAAAGVDPSYVYRLIRKHDL